MTVASHPGAGYAGRDDIAGSAAGNGVPSAATLRGGGLVQRRSELAAIESALKRAEFGRGGLVVLFGVAGIGRSSPIAAGVEAARAREFTVLCARGSVLERDYGFGVARQLLGGTIAGLSQATRRSLFEGAAAGAREPLGFTSGPKAIHAEYAQITALHSVAERLAAEMPLMIAVDDLQWCDRLTLDFLCYLGQRATELPIVIVGSWRPGEPRARAGRLQALAGDRDTLFLTLGALDRSGVAELLEREYPGGTDREVVDACFQRRAIGSCAAVRMAARLTSALAGSSSQAVSRQRTSSEPRVASGATAAAASRSVQEGGGIRAASSSPLLLL